MWNIVSLYQLYLLDKEYLVRMSDLLVSVVQEDIPAIENLLERGANPSIRMKGRLVVLERMLNKGHIDVVELLVLYGAKM